MENLRQKIILNLLESKGELKIADFMRALPDYTKMTINRDLLMLIKNNKVCKKGIGKATVYSKSLTLDNYFDIPFDDRVILNEYYNFDIWNSLNELLTTTEQKDYSDLNKLYINKLNNISPALLKKEIERITIELSWKSSQIEGNTFTILDTEKLIKENKEATGKTSTEAIMILNHKKAIDYIFTSKDFFKEISVKKIEDLHRILVEEMEIPFNIRERLVRIIGTKYRPLDNHQQIKEQCEILCDKINKLQNPLEKALLAVLMISYIQPFEDGNKRTARILGNAILIAGGYCPLSYRNVNEIKYKKAMIYFYEQNNFSYFKSLFIQQFEFAVDNYF